MITQNMVVVDDLPGSSAVCMWRILPKMAKLCSFTAELGWWGAASDPISESLRLKERLQELGNSPKSERSRRVDSPCEVSGATLGYPFGHVGTSRGPNPHHGLSSLVNFTTPDRKVTKKTYYYMLGSRICTTSIPILTGQLAFQNVYYYILLLTGNPILQ